MTPTTKTVLITGAVVAAAAAIYFATKRDEEKEEQPRALTPRTLGIPLVTLSLPPVPSQVNEAEPSGGWQAWATESAVFTSLRGCASAAGTTQVETWVACALENLFPKAKWPPAPEALEWQHAAWQATETVALGLQNSNM